MIARAEDLPGLLSDARISGMKSLRPRHTEKLTCPQCGGGSDREKSLSVTIDDDGEGATWQCHRGKCGWKGGGRVGIDEPGAPAARRQRQAEPRLVQPPPQHALVVQRRSEPLYEFFARRGISAETVDTFGCYLFDRKFPGLGERTAIVWPYVFNGRLVNHKYRPPEKHPMLQDTNALPTLFNIDAVTSADVVVWVEGEPDCMALHEAGYPQTVSLKDGAPAQLRAENDPEREHDKRFASLSTHADLLQKVQKFILAGDADEPGAVLREELARRLGRHRCWLVTWPEDCKDACDTLKLHGRERVQQCIEAAEPYPISGVQRLRGDTLLQLRRQPPPPVLTTGVQQIDRVMKFPGEGRVIVVTGLPNAGKSSWVRWVMVRLMDRCDRRWAVFSPEMQPWEQFAASCAEVYWGKPFWPVANVPSLTDPEIAEAEVWLSRRIAFLVSDAEDESPTLPWILERARLGVLRDGTTDLLIDPWNEIEHQRGALQETEYVGRALQQIRSFAARHGCNVWIVAHPAKMQPIKPGAEVPPPGLYDIAGSAHFANKSDLAVTVHTPTGKPSEILLRKSRFARWGRKGGRVELDYDPLCGRYYPQATPLALGPEDDQP